MEYIFVYGTLVKGMSNAKILKDIPLFRDPAFVVGGELYDVGAFPALIPNAENNCKIKGELLSMSTTDFSKVIDRLDRLEGYSPFNPHSLYRREKVNIQRKGSQEVTAWVYYFNRSVEGLKQIPFENNVADYKKYLEGK